MPYLLGIMNSKESGEPMRLEENIADAPSEDLKSLPNIIAPEYLRFQALSRVVRHGKMYMMRIDWNRHDGYDT